MAYYANIRYAVTNMQRLFEECRMGHITGPVTTFSVFSNILGMGSISVFSQVWEVMCGHTLSFIGVIYVRYVSRRICHASHVLLVEFCVLRDDEPRRWRHPVAMVGWHVHGLCLG